RALGCDTFIEVGPQPTLLGMARRCLEDDQLAWLPSLRRGQEDWKSMLEALAALYRGGSEIDWPAVHRDAPWQRLALPTYPFRRTRFWVDVTPVLPSAPARYAEPGGKGHPALGRRLRSALPDVQFEFLLSAET